MKLLSKWSSLKKISKWKYILMEKLMALGIVTVLWVLHMIKESKKMLTMGSPLFMCKTTLSSSACVNLNNVLFWSYIRHCSTASSWSCANMDNYRNLFLYICLSDNEQLEEKYLREFLNEKSPSNQMCFSSKWPNFFDFNPNL